MADTVNTITLLNTPTRLVIKCLSISDGSGETGVIKVQKNTFTGPNGLEPSSFAIEKIIYAVAGMAVAVISDASATDLVLALLSGYDTQDYTDAGGISTKVTGTGNLYFNTFGASSGDTYEITLYLRKKD